MSRSDCSQDAVIRVRCKLCMDKVRGLPLCGERLRPWSSWTASSDKKYMELNGAALNVNKPYMTSRKTAFSKDKYR